MIQPNSKIYANAPGRQRAYRQRLKRRTTANQSGLAAQSLASLHAAIESARAVGNPLAQAVYLEDSNATAIALAKYFFHVSTGSAAPDS